MRLIFLNQICTDVDIWHNMTKLPESFTSSKWSSPTIAESFSAIFHGNTSIYENNEHDKIAFFMGIIQIAISMNWAKNPWRNLMQFPHYVFMQIEPCKRHFFNWITCCDYKLTELQTTNIWVLLSDSELDCLRR